VPRCFATPWKMLYGKYLPRLSLLRWFEPPSFFVLDSFSRKMKTQLPFSGLAPQCTRSSDTAFSVLGLPPRSLLPSTYCPPPSTNFPPLSCEVFIFPWICTSVLFRQLHCQLTLLFAILFPLYFPFGLRRRSPLSANRAGALSPRTTVSSSERCV